MVGVLAAMRQAAREEGFALDDGQARAAARLDRLAQNIGGDRGVYLWGPVGRGKTWLLDNFFVALPTQRKKRFHFQAFFGEYQRAVHRHGTGRHATDQGVSDLLGEVDVVCFDEFHAHDPGDATLLARLLRGLLVERAASIVITSNYEPDALLPSRRYHYTMQPAIDLINSPLDIVAIDASVDYRELGVGARVGFRAGTYRVALHTSDGRVPVSVGTRSLHAVEAHDEAIVFEFADLCDRPVSALDVLHLCSKYRVWTIHNVPELHRISAEAAQRFINFIDVLHDQNATLHITSSHKLEELISGEPLPPDVLRASSRLSMLTKDP
jgi:cell division protein ZapE